MQIRDTSINDAALLAGIISESNRDVAERFGLNGDNCPKHPSLCTEDWVLADFARGERYFILEDEGSAIGCVAYENPSEGLAYLNRLSVLPGHRRRGAGEQLVRHVIDLARSSQIETISIGIIAANEELKRWYLKLGFIEGETKTFPHLPFAVCYLRYDILPARR
jgi:ribosomal protein S18 acetylase RimI-like enzyme